MPRRRGRDSGRKLGRPKTGTQLEQQADATAHSRSRSAPVSKQTKRRQLAAELGASPADYRAGEPIDSDDAAISRRRRPSSLDPDRTSR